MLKVAVIGCGGIGGIHLARWSNLSGIRLAAVCDSDTARAHRTGAEFGAEAHTDWRGVLDESDFDVVDICTPRRDQRDIAKTALSSGANVLSAKPKAMNSAEAREMALAAESAGRLLMPAFHYRFDPAALFAREMVRNDDLGRPIMLRSRFSANRPEVGNDWRADSAQSGGGALIDTGTDCIDLFRNMADEVASAAGFTLRANPLLSVEDSAVLALKSEKGALGAIECSWSTPGGTNVLEIYGTAGACIVDFDSGRVRYMTADMSVWETREVTGPDRFERMIGHFADAVRGNQGPEISAYDGIRALEIVEQIYAAA